MTDLQPSERYEVWHRLVERFRLTASSAYSAFVSGTIQPVTNVDELLRVPRVLSATLDLSGTVGTQMIAFTGS